MRVNCNKYRRSICQKCKEFTGDKLIFGKCIASEDKIYSCARRLIFIDPEYEKLTKE